MKKSSKKLLSALLAMVMALCSLPFLGVTFSAGAENDGYYTYTVYNGKATITDFDSRVSGNVVIPSTLGGYPVTSIGYDAFEYCTGLTSITIPDSVTSIGDYAFRSCAGLTSISIPDSVTSIGGDAFYGCTGLTSITIPNSVTSIGYGTFYGCDSLTSISIPDGVTSIGFSAFSGCTGLTSVTIPDSVTSIGYSAFSGCTGLTSVTIGDSVTSIGDRAFYNCTGLTSVTIPNSVTSIGEEAFEYCTNLTSITIPNSVTSIGDWAFRNCTGLTSVTIGNSVTRISDYLFSGCTDLTSVTIGNSVTSIGSCAFYGCTGLTSLTIGNSVTSIGFWAFYDCTGLRSITIPDSVTSIGRAAFYNTDYYNNNSNWENGVLYIGNHLIKAKSSVSGVYTIKDETKSIADYAFLDCDNLTSITIPESVVSIGCKALGYYYSLSVGNDERIYNFTVTGYRNTAAETYANENGFAFIALDEEHTHTFGEQIIGQPTCTNDGEKILTCTQCAYSYTEIIPATGHTDNDNDGNCDRCGEKVGEPVNPPEPTNPSENCSCACHKGGIEKLFFKIGLFFQKLFKKNQVCKCGAWHY